MMVSWFQLVPCRPALEQRLGQHVAGTMTRSGAVDRVRHVLPQQRSDPVAGDPLPWGHGEEGEQGDRLARAERDLLPTRSTQLKPAQKINAPAVHSAHRDAGAA